MMLGHEGMKGQAHSISSNFAILCSFEHFHLPIG